jgi:hypothetical protein
MQSCTCRLLDCLCLRLIRGGLVEYSTKIARGSAFIMHELPKTEWHYQGGGVKLGDAKTAIFWYKPQDSDTYQVLHGDLRVDKDVAETGLPKKTLPSEE